MVEMSDILYYNISELKNNPQKLMNGTLVHMQKKFTETMKHYVIVMKNGHANVQWMFNLGV